ncbi:MAG: flagellar motor protein MotB [Papillibacter sp.]|nr:flagellar motor protein MotB [Papillibacter sp.]
MARRPEEEESTGYSWMDTYGDMVTLLLCFFVFLYSFSSIDGIKWKHLVSALSGTGGNRYVTAIGESRSRDENIAIMNTSITFNKVITKQPEDAGFIIDESSSENGIDELYRSILEFIRQNNMGGTISVSRTTEAIYLRFNEMALFNSGYADILPESKQTINNIMIIIERYIKYIAAIRIEGHTDNVPINTAEFKDNWDLSAKRATNVLRLVLTYNLFDPSMLSAVGYGEFQPLADNSSPEGRALNRRVDFVLVRADDEVPAPSEQISK